MKTILSLALMVFSSFCWSQSHMGVFSAYFERPISCPLRFSNLSQLRDQAQSLTSILGNGCTQNGQQALKQLNSSVGNLEGIASAWTTYQGTDQKAQNALLAKNASQVLGSLNIITSNNACFYDIRSRGALPVVADIVMSLSQIALLVPSATGVMVAAGGYMAGSGLKIINELVKRKFNWNRPEERRAFLQLNCAFFDNRKVMEEMGLFNPETKASKDQLLADYKKERLELIKTQKKQEVEVKEYEAKLNTVIANIAAAKEKGLNPLLKRKLDELNFYLASKPADYSAKWKQVSQLAILAPEIRDLLKELKLEEAQQNLVQIMLNNLEVIIPELSKEGKAWTCSIDEYEMKYRGPTIAFVTPISDSLAKSLSVTEAVASAEDKILAEKLSNLRSRHKESRYLTWGATQRLISLESKIASIETSGEGAMFSQEDEGKSDAVELLDYYRKLQKSILGKEGKGYLKNSISSIEDLKDGLQFQTKRFDEANQPKEKCSAAEKLRFVWAQYRYKVQESYDFVATNLDLYRSSFKIGKERQKRSTSYVNYQISSVEEATLVDNGSIGFHMNYVRSVMDGIEAKIRDSGCF